MKIISSKAVILELFEAYRYKGKRKTYWQYNNANHNNKKKGSPLAYDRRNRIDNDFDLLRYVIS